MGNNYEMAAEEKNEMLIHECLYFGQPIGIISRQENGCPKDLLIRKQLPRAHERKKKKFRRARACFLSLRLSQDRVPISFSLSCGTSK